MLLYHPQIRRSSAVEQLTVNQLVVGSIPTAGANFRWGILDKYPPFYLLNKSQSSSLTLIRYKSHPVFVLKVERVPFWEIEKKRYSFWIKLRSLQTNFTNKILNFFLFSNDDIHVYVLLRNLNFIVCNFRQITY